MESPRQSELVYNYNRDYDPQTGRYIESDPIGLQGGINGYLYANADPLSFIDPEGLTGNSAQRRGARRAQPPGSASPSTNDPGNTEDTLGVGARGAGCAFAFLSEAASQACMPKNNRGRTTINFK